MVKNVIVVNDFSYINGGAGKVAIMSAVALAKQGLNVFFFCGTGPVCDELKKSDVTIVSTDQGDITKGNKIKGLLQGINNNVAEKKMYELLRKLDRKETIVHCHAWSKILSTSIFKATKKAKVPVVITGHDYGTVCPNGCFFDFRENRICNCNPLGWKCIVKNCDKKRYIYKLFRIIRQFINRKFIQGNNIHYFFISEFSKKKIKQAIVWKIHEHFVVNPIEVKKIENADIEKNNIYLFIGRVSQEKGIPIFCEAMKARGSKGIVIGDGPILNTLSQKYPMVDFVGWKSSEEISRYAIKAKGLVFPSVWYEAAPLTIPEVMGKYGLPCIVSDACAGQDYINDGVNGYIFENGNVKDLLNKLSLLDDNAKLLQENILNTFDRDIYSENNHAKNLIKEYDNILKNVI